MHCSCDRPLHIRHWIEAQEMWFCDDCGRCWVVDPIDGLCEVKI